MKNKPPTIRKAVDLSMADVKTLSIDAIENNHANLKNYMEHILRERAKQVRKQKRGQ